MARRLPFDSRLEKEVAGIAHNGITLATSAQLVRSCTAITKKVVSALLPPNRSSRIKAFVAKPDTI